MRLTLFGGLRPFTPGGTLRNAIAGITLASMNIIRGSPARRP
jgi:hypothetical protein